MRRSVHTHWCETRVSTRIQLNRSGGGENQNILVDKPLYVVGTKDSYQGELNKASNHNGSGNDF